MKHSDIAKLGTILSVWAHPDDETYLAGGVMAAAAELGQRVICVCASDGEHGTSDPAASPPERLAPVRRSEFAAAMDVLGVREHRMLGLPDGALAEHEQAGLATLIEVIDEIRPDTILTFGPDGVTFHPDHIAVNRWVGEAWRRDGCRARFLCTTSTTGHLERFGVMYEEWGVYMADARPVGARREELALHLELTGAALDRKLAALRCLASQTSGAIATLGSTYSELVAEEAFVEIADVALTTPFEAVSAT